jgi:hypothetical protein
MALVIWCAGAKVSEPGFQRESLSLGNLGQLARLEIVHDLTLGAIAISASHLTRVFSATRRWSARRGLAREMRALRMLIRRRALRPSPCSRRYLTGCWPLFRRAAINAPGGATRLARSTMTANLRLVAANQLRLSRAPYERHPDPLGLALTGGALSSRPSFGTIPPIRTLDFAF